MKSVVVMLLLCLTVTGALASDPKSSGPPDIMWLCPASGDCVVLEIHGRLYVPLMWSGAFPDFTYHLDAWEPGFIALTGTCMTPDKNGRREVSVITGVRDQRKDRTVRVVRHLIVGGKDAVQKMTIGWDKDSQGQVATEKLGVQVVPGYGSNY